jgi:VWFA-related protein
MPKAFLLKAYCRACFCFVLGLPAVTFAQQLPPIEPPAPLPAPSAAASPNTGTPTFHITSNVVLVPTLVEQKQGQVVYTLGAKDFTLTDNGVPQKIHVDDDMDTTPVSMVVCVQNGRSSPLEFDKIERMAPLLNLFLGNGNGRVSLVEFDSQVEYQGDWTSDTDEVEHDLERMQPGDDGAALLDAAGYSIGELEHQPPNRRRILLLISESRDHGSKHVSPKALAEEIGASNTLVLSLTWSPTKAEYLSDLTHPGSGGIDVIALIKLAANAMKANAAKTLATMSGGESMSFTTEHGFEDRIAEMASHARNRYMLSFRPTDLTPGLHSLNVSLATDIPARVVARTDYWAGPSDPDEWK